MCMTRNHHDSLFDRLSFMEIKHLILRRFRFAGGCRLILSGGEPTLSEDLEEILKYADRIGLSIYLATNFYQMDDQRMRRILNIMSDPRHKIVVSYDSVCPEEIKAIRGVDAHQIVTSNLISFIQLKKDLGAAMKLGAALTLQESNSRNIAKTIGFLTHLDLDQIHIQPVNLYGEISETNFHLVHPSCSRENLQPMLDAVETVFLLARDDRRICLSYPDIERWRRHFSSPTNQRHICKSNRIIYISRRGDYFGCMQSRAYANVREIGMVDFLKSNHYAQHLRLLERCNICTQECS